MYFSNPNIIPIISIFLSFQANYLDLFLTHFAHSSHIFSGNSGCILKCSMSWLCLVSIIIRQWINAELRIRIKSKWAISWFKSFMMMVCDFSIGFSFNFSLLHHYFMGIYIEWTHSTDTSWRCNKFYLGTLERSVLRMWIVLVGCAIYIPILLFFSSLSIE